MEYINSKDLQCLGPMAVPPVRSFSKNKNPTFGSRSATRARISATKRRFLNKWKPALEAYRKMSTRKYYDMLNEIIVGMRDPNPVIIIYPGVGIGSVLPQKTNQTYQGSK